MLSGGPPAGDDSTLTITGTTWDDTTHRDTMSVTAAFSGANAQVTRAALPIPPVPTAVWLVVGLFAVLTLGIAVAWLVVAQRTARRRAELEANTAEREARPVAISADLPTSG